MRVGWVGNPSDLRVCLYINASGENEQREKTEGAYVLAHPYLVAFWDPKNSVAHPAPLRSLVFSCFNISKLFDSGFDSHGDPLGNV